MSEAAAPSGLTGDGLRLLREEQMRAELAWHGYSESPDLQHRHENESHVEFEWSGPRIFDSRTAGLSCLGMRDQVDCKGARIRANPLKERGSDAIVTPMGALEIALV